MNTLSRTTCGLATILCALCTPKVEASITYTYTGNDYAFAVPPYTTSMDVTGSFTFASPLPANSVFVDTDLPTTWSISDGVDTITNSTSTLTFDVATNSVGGIVAWAFATPFTVPTGILEIESFDDPNHLFISGSDFLCGTNTACDGIEGVAAGHAVGLAGVINDRGTWSPTSTVSSVPEPSFVFPLAIGLALLAWIARRRTGSVKA